MKKKSLIKFLILASVTAFNISEVFACDSALQSPEFVKDCSIQDRYRSARETFRKYKKNITDVNEYKSIRFIDRYHWDSEGNEKKTAPKFIYSPAPSTWEVWNSGINSLFPGDQGEGRLAEMIENNVFDNAYLSLVNKVLLTNGIVSVKDRISDQTEREGEIRSSFRSAPGYCSSDGYRYTSDVISNVKNSVQAYQKAWERKANISFKDMVKQYNGMSPRKASMEPDMVVTGNSCPWDSNGVFVYYASSRDVLKSLNWMQIFVRYNLQRYKEGHPVIAPIELAAFVQKWIVSTHPFGDGNGRTSRAIQDLILQNFDLPFAPGGDLQNDALAEVNSYLELTYKKTEDMVKVLERCAQELKDGKESSYSCQSTTILNK